MLFNFIVHVLTEMIKTILGVLPTATATPTAIVTAGAWVTNTIKDFISVLRWLYGGTLLDAMVVVIIALFTFDKLYHAAMWILRKIPILNIK